LFAIKSLNVTGGGAEKVMTQVVNALAARGHDVVVVTFDGAGPSFFPLADGVERVRLDVGEVGRSTPRMELLGALPRLRRAVTAVQPDVVVGFMHSMFVPLGLALAATRFPLIASEHAGIEYYRTVPAQRALLELAPHLTEVTTVPSPRVRASFPPRLRRRMVVIPNPIVAPVVADAKHQASDAERIVLAVGRLDHLKNHGELIAAFASLAACAPEWTLRIVGDGALREVLASQIRASGLSGRVQLCGATSDVDDEYERAAIVAVPSRIESFGLVTAEALAAGRPVIGFADCPGTNELIDHGVNGWLVSGEDDRVTALADGLLRLMTDAPLRRRLGAAGPPSVSTFDLDVVADRWERLLEGCVRRNGR
jgi:glycosyltransferase involved in cell wall biosynthesis